MKQPDDLRDFDRMQREMLMRAAETADTSESFFRAQERIKEETRPIFLAILAQRNPHSFISHETPHTV